MPWIEQIKFMARAPAFRHPRRKGSVRVAGQKSAALVR